MPQSDNNIALTTEMSLIHASVVEGKPTRLDQCNSKLMCLGVSDTRYQLVQGFCASLNWHCHVIYILFICGYFYLAYSGEGVEGCGVTRGPPAGRQSDPPQPPSLQHISLAPQSELFSKSVHIRAPLAATQSLGSELTIAGHLEKKGVI